MFRTTTVLLVALLLPVTALAQLQAPASPTATRPVSLPGSPPPTLPTATRPSSVPPPTRDDAQREDPQPRVPPPPRPVKPPVKPVTPPPPMRPIYDSKGQRVEGMRQAGPNRVFDQRTGRYHTTEPSGVGQRIVPPPAGAKPQR